MRDVRLRNLGDLDFDLSRTLKVRDVIYYNYTSKLLQLPLLLHYFQSIIITITLTWVSITITITITFTTIIIFINKKLNHKRVGKVADKHIKISF